MSRTDNAKEPEIRAAEEDLKVAMVESDIDQLEKLIAPDLIFTNHLGQVLTKDDDLNGHRSGDFKIDNIDLSEQVIKPLGDLFVVSVLATITGHYKGSPANGKFRFTRLWKKHQGIWQVAAGHSSLVS